MAGGHLTAVNENGRRKTQWPSPVERDRRCDRRLRNSSLCFTTLGAAESTSDRHFLGQTGDKCIRSLVFPGVGNAAPQSAGPCR